MEDVHHFCATFSSINEAFAVVQSCVCLFLAPCRTEVTIRSTDSVYSSTAWFHNGGVLKIEAAESAYFGTLSKFWQWIRRTEPNRSALWKGGITTENQQPVCKIRLNASNINSWPAR